MTVRRSCFMSTKVEAENDPWRWRHAEPRWELFQDNKAIWEAVLERCDAAKHSIVMEQYIFGSHGVGRRLLDLLTAKARQGVSVRVLADGLGSLGLERCEGAQSLIRAGGRIAMYNSVLDLIRHPIARAHRLHRKTVIYDASSIMTGGSCYLDRMATWRDTMIFVEGPLPPAVTREFELAWQRANHRPVATNPDHGTNRKVDSGWFYGTSGPLVQARPTLAEVLLGKIAKAERSVSLTTPYLIPDRRLWRTLTAAAARGVRVQILMPQKSDHLVLTLIGGRFAHALSRHGIDVRGYTPAMIHAKVALVDGEWSSVSSFNLDVFSSRLNLESGIYSTSPRLYGALAEQMDADLQQSVRL